MKISLLELRQIVRSVVLERKSFDVDLKHMAHPKFVWMPIEKIGKNTEVWSDEKLDAVRDS
jgi:hypothetical protein